MSDFDHSSDSSAQWRLGAIQTVVTSMSSSTRVGSPSIHHYSGRGMRVRESPSPNPTTDGSNVTSQTLDTFIPSKYQDILLSQQSAEAVEAVIQAACIAMGFEIGEVWLRTGSKTHQLINSHLRATALDEITRSALVDVYYGDGASDRTHRLSPALCKKAKEDNDVVWVSAQTETGARALKCSLNGVLAAVAVPVCHEPSNTNMTMIYFSVKRSTMRSEATEFLVHMSLAAAVAGVNNFSKDTVPLEDQVNHLAMNFKLGHDQNSASSSVDQSLVANSIQRPLSAADVEYTRSEHPTALKSHLAPDRRHGGIDTSRGIRPVPVDDRSVTMEKSVTGADLNLTWSKLRNIEYLTDGGNNWIHTAVMDNHPIVIKQLKPEVKDVAVAMNEIEDELKVHAQLNHENIVSLIGAGFTSDNSRFLVLERLDGGTLAQKLGYDTRIRDRRRRFWKKNKMSYVAVLKCAKQIADAMDYCHRIALNGKGMILHRDLKPDNIGFTLDGTVKVIDFGLARVLEGTDTSTNELFEMSGETGSLRYMAPEIASAKPYNHKGDIYSFGMILWEILSMQKPFAGMNRDEFYDLVVHGGHRPDIGKRIPEEVAKLIRSCWSTDPNQRPNFQDISNALRGFLEKEQGGKRVDGGKKFSGLLGRLPKNRELKDRHSTWF